MYARLMTFLYVSLQTQACDFLGERLAGALGLNAAKYQYAIDQYHHDRKVVSNSTATKQVYWQKVNSTV